MSVTNIQKMIRKYKMEMFSFRRILSVVSWILAISSFGVKCSVRAFVPPSKTIIGHSTHPSSLSKQQPASLIALRAASNPYERYSQMQDVWWDQMSDLLEQYLTRYGNIDVPFNYYVRLDGPAARSKKRLTADGDDHHNDDVELINLGKFVRRQREAKRANKLPKYKCARLEDLGMNWHSNSGLKDAYTVTVSPHLKDASMDFAKWKRSFNFDGQVPDRSVATWISADNMQNKVLRLKPTKSVGRKIDIVNRRSRWDVTREGWMSHANYNPFPWYS